MGMHVYLPNRREEPIHSHAQNLHTFTFKGIFQDEIFTFALDPSGCLVRYKISKEFSDDHYELFFEREERFVISHSFLRLIREREIGYLTAENAHMVRAGEGVITLYRFSGQFLDSSTFLTEKSALSLSAEQTIEEKTKMIDSARGILEKYIS